MKFNKKIIGIILIIIVVAFVLSFFAKLFYEWNVWIEHKDAMITLATMTIPGYSLGAHDDMNIEERDEYGRYLFSVDHMENAPRAFIIVQKTYEDGWCYYYAGQSTLLVYDIWNLTEEEKAKLEQLKEQNDWNRPLQEEKMTKVAIKNN